MGNMGKFVSPLISNSSVMTHPINIELDHVIYHLLLLTLRLTCKLVGGLIIIKLSLDHCLDQ